MSEELAFRAKERQSIEAEKDKEPGETGSVVSRSMPPAAQYGSHDRLGGLSFVASHEVYNKARCVID